LNLKKRLPDYVIRNIEKGIFGIRKIYGVAQEGMEVQEEAAIITNTKSDNDHMHTYSRHHSNKKNPYQSKLISFISKIYWYKTFNLN